MEEKIIVDTPSSDIRAEARRILKNNWLEFGIICSLMSFVESIGEILTGTVFESGISRIILKILFFVITAALVLGVSKYSLKIVRGEKANSRDILYGFENIVKASKLELRKYIFTILWFICFIIPGIIASIKYSLSLFIMVDNEEYSGGQCVEKSKMLTHGNKQKIFYLLFSFIGWQILITIAMITLVVLSSAIGMIDLQMNSNSVLELGYNAKGIMKEMQSLENIRINILISFVESIMQGFLVAYITTSLAVLYEMIIGNIKIKGNSIEEPIVDVQYNEISEENPKDIVNG